MKSKQHRLYYVTFVILLLLLLPVFARFSLAPKFAHAQKGAAVASQVKAESPHPHFKTSGAVGVAASFQAPAAQGVVQAAALQSLNDWTPDVEEGFESGLDGARWAVSDENPDDGAEYTWGLDSNQVNSGTQALWVAAGGADAPGLSSHFYPPNMDTWLVLQTPLDLRTVQAADVEFHMFVETEPQYDWVFVGVSLDGQNYTGEYWEGDSGGWQSYSLDLSEYLGYENVSVAWYFHSDGDNQGAVDYAGVWLDDITVWTYVDSPPPTSDQLIQNGDFETGDLTGWTVPSGSTVIATDQFTPTTAGNYVAWFGGISNANESFYQLVTLPNDAGAEAHLGFWVNQFGEETESGVDRFCVWLAEEADPNSKLVDLGCMDGAGAFTVAFAAEGWWQVDYTFTPEEWSIVNGKRVNLVFTMQTNDALDTSYLVDDVSLSITTGGAPGDALEPNDTRDTATIPNPAPGNDPATYKELTIAPDGDVDLFRVTANAGNTLFIDIDAASHGSPLDSVVAVLDQDGNEVLDQDGKLCENDDDGVTTDSSLYCKLANGGDYFVQVRSYAGDGDRNFSYTIQIFLLGDGAATPTPEPTPAPTPTPTPTSGPAPKKWTAILYLDGDNNLCNAYPGLITRMESQLGAKIDPTNGFLNVVVLLDQDPNHCNGQSKTIRYLVQTNGQYTDGVNRWDMGEQNMGDPQILINFATWAMQNYPAEHYYLAIDDHGGGVSGIAWDDSNNNDNITNAELYAALKQITNNGARKIDLFAYEACLMGMYENAYDLHEFVNYIYFWPTISFTADTYPAYLGAAGFTAASSAEDLGKIMFDVYYGKVTNHYILSLVDASKLPALHQAVEAWAAKLQTQLIVDKAGMTAGRSAAQKIDANGDDKLTDADFYVDLWDLAEKLKNLAPTETAALQQAITAATVKTAFRNSAVLNYSNAHTLSIYWPPTANGDYSAYTSNRIYQTATTGKWREFLTSYFGNARGLAGSSLGPIDRQPATPSSTFAVTTNVVGQGTVAANPQGPYASGQQVTLTATPAQGWVFSGWSGDASGTTNPLTVTMDGNKSITATFTQQASPANLLYLPIISR